jgi:hypothetical protein
MYKEVDVADEYIETEILQGIQKCRRRPDLGIVQARWEQELDAISANDFSELDLNFGLWLETRPLMVHVAASNAPRMGA